MELQGARVVITGASRGIGAGLAEGFALAGARVALVARSEDAITELAARLGGDAYPCDLGDLSRIDDLVARIEADGPIDVLVNNAGIARIKHVLDVTPADIDEVLAVNLQAPLHLINRILPGMVQRGRGHIVNVSSLAAVMNPPGLSTYGASKAALSHYTALLRHDLRDLPIDTTTVHLGSVPTEMDDQARSYGPLRQAAERSKGADITPLDVVVRDIVAAVRTGKRHVRLPRQFALLPALTEAPRRITELVFGRTDTSAGHR